MFTTDTYHTVSPLFHLNFRSSRIKIRTKLLNGQGTRIYLFNVIERQNHRNRHLVYLSMNGQMKYLTNTLIFTLYHVLFTKHPIFRHIFKFYHIHSSSSKGVRSIFLLRPQTRTNVTRRKDKTTMVVITYGQN